MIRDLTACRFGRLIVLSLSPIRGENYKTRWNCLCDCGNTLTISGRSLLSENTKSCGCYKRDAISESRSTHKMCKTPEYKTWCLLKSRCLNKRNPKYPIYGGRGINVCDRWINSFQNFLDDVGTKPTPGHSIDRIYVNGHYEPSNVKWSTRKEQQNNKRNNRLLTYDGRTLTVAQWADLLMISQQKIINRLYKKYSTEDALYTGSFGNRGNKRNLKRLSTES